MRRETVKREDLLRSKAVMLLGRLSKEQTLEQAVSYLHDIWLKERYETYEAETGHKIPALWDDVSLKQICE